MSIKASSVASNEKVSVDFLSLGKDNVEDSYGFYFDNGKIFSMPGYSQHEFTKVMGKCNKVLYNSYNDRVMFFLTDGSVKLLDEESFTRTTLEGSASCPQYLLDCYFDGNHYQALLCGKKLHKLKADGTVETTDYLTETYCCVYHYGRLFDVSPTDDCMFCWTVQGMTSYEADGVGKAGYMRVPKGAGTIRRMFSLGDRIVILRDYGINVMRGLADTRNFTLEPNTVMLSEKLIENTAICDGRKVWFCTKRYIYCFDGATLTEIEHPYGSDDDKIICLDIIDARYLYLSITQDKANYLVRYDTLTGEFIRFAKNCKNICKTPKGLITMYITNKIGKLVKDAMFINQMKFKKVDFGNRKYKTLKSIAFDADPGVTLKVTLNDCEYSFGTGEHDNLNMTARSFDFSLTGNGDVKQLIAVWEVFK